MRFVLGICLILMLFRTGNSQHLFTRTLTTSDGLYQTENGGVLMTHDSVLLVWESNKGVSIFDGYSFETFDSLPFESYIASVPLYTKDITLITNQSDIYMYAKGKMERIPHPEIGGNTTPFVENDTIFVLYDKTIYKLDTNEAEWVPHKSLPPFVIQLFEENQIGSNYFRKNGKDYISINNNGITTFFQVIDSTLIPNKKAIKMIGFDEIWNNLSELSKNKITQIGNVPFAGNPWNQKQNIFSFKLKDNSAALAKIDKDTFSLLGIIPSDGHRPVHINEQQVIIGSHHGLHFINPAITYFPTSHPELGNGLHTIFEDREGNIWFGCYEAGLTVWEGQKLKKLPGYPDHRILPGALLHSSGDVLLFTERDSKGLHKFRDGVLENIAIEGNIGFLATGYLIKEFVDGKTIFGFMDIGIGITEDVEGLPESLQLISKDEGMLLGNVLSIDRDLTGRIWAGRHSTGIAVADPDALKAFTWLRSPEDPQSLGAISMKTDSLGNLWFGTNNGLYFLENPHEIRFGDTLFFEKFKFIPFPNGDRSLVTFVEQIDHYIVAGNASAVNFLDLGSFYENPDSPIIYQLIYGEDIHGGGSEQNAILLDSQRRLWIGSQEGASMIKWDQSFFDQSLNRIDIRNVRTGNIDISYIPGNKITIPTDNRNCTIQFGPYKNPSLLKNIFFDYALINKKGDTITHKKNDQNGIFEMEYMPPGKYYLHIHALKHGQVMDTLDVPIIVPLSLTENPFYWAAIILLLSGGFFFYLFTKNRQERRILEKDLKLSQLNNEKEQLQIQAIISSFNPHFINNSLHWVQSRYNEDPEMVKMVDRLSRNIQYIFENSRKGKAFHYLSNEIELVKNYFTIQRLRFDEPLQLKLPEPKILERYANFPILLMQLQIHVENAIEHGLRNRYESSFVEIRIEEEEKYIILEIIDDGAGRVKAKQIDSRGTENGTGMLTELHAIFNENNEYKIQSVYDDEIFTDEKSGMGYGTKVIIKLPKIYTYEFDTHKIMRHR